MNTKNIIFALIIISCNAIYGNQYPANASNGYSPESGYQPTSHHHISVQSSSHQLNPAQAADIKRLEALEKEEKEQYFHTNACWGVTIVGILLTCASIITKTETSTTRCCVVLTVGSGGLGIVSMGNENYKASQRAKERAEISERLNKYANTMIIR